jgi:catechol 2,3-dioxygenase-like lactoylglutathione lyase family enzyme
MSEATSAAPTAPSSRLEYRLELVILPVSDVDRSKAFYVDQVGFNADHDQTVSEQVRFVQLTPHGSACSIAFGLGLTDAEPGSVKGLQVVVDDAQAAYDELSARGVPVDGVHDEPWGRFVFFEDPDGNKWALQELPAWSKGRTDQG